MKTWTTGVLALLATLAGAAYSLHGGHAGAHAALHDHLHARAQARDTGAPFVLVTHNVPLEGREEELLQELVLAAELTTGQPGLLFWQVLEPHEPGEAITSVWAWTSDRSFEAFHASKVFRAYHEDGGRERVEALSERFTYGTFDQAGGWAQARLHGGADER